MKSRSHSASSFCSRRLLSLFPAVLCSYAISRNNCTAMQASITLTLMAGCGPLLYGAFIMMDDAFVFFTGNQAKIRGEA